MTDLHFVPAAWRGSPVSQSNRCPALLRPSTNAHRPKRAGLLSLSSLRPPARRFLHPSAPPPSPPRLRAGAQHGAPVGAVGARVQQHHGAAAQQGGVRAAEVPPGRSLHHLTTGPPSTLPCICATQAVRVTSRGLAVTRNSSSSTADSGGQAISCCPSRRGGPAFMICRSWAGL